MNHSCSAENEAHADFMSGFGLILKMPKLPRAFLPVQRHKLLSVQNTVPVVVEELAELHAQIVAGRGAAVLLHGL